MSRVRIVGGTITKTSKGAYNMYSDENIVHSSGKAISEVGEENGITFGEPKEVPKKENLNEKIINCVVNFRRCNDYMDLSRDEKKGDKEPDNSKIYGFDWMRDEYKDSYGYYWEGDATKRDVENKILSEKDLSARFSNLENEYSPINIEWKKDKYYTPWLSLYENQTVRLRLTMDWDNKPNELKWDEEYSHSDCLKLPDPTSIEIKKGKGMFSSYQDVEIECIGIIEEEKEIRLLADGKLAGRIRILPNKKKTLKITWCLVDVSGKNLKGDYKDIKNLENKLNKQKIERFVKYLSFSQALIDVEATSTFKEIKLSDSGKVWGEYNQYPGFTHNGKGIINTSALENDCISEYEKINKNDPNHIVMFLINNYKPSIKIMNRVINEIPNANTVGHAIDFGSKYLMLYEGFDSHNKTVVHEILHCLGLKHSFDKIAKHKFKAYQTDNFMDYVYGEQNDIRTSLWKWQWDVIRSKL
ncbi:hypothetical protein HNQ02_001476 [Flavobacterium sp. 7E]|uniref:hypothetical protein n=1 Tax=Flavobacterium sp. 7E TaxID=2735898 RepID=UPI00157130AC|nr:hypothetical protein [Flavobacterium sp. 7E]NRS88562.1 hypothetical protein [Flavobacterium sp. 7E]